MNRNEIERRLILLRESAIRKARVSFWSYCKLRAPEFYKEGRSYLKEICDTLQNLYEGKLLKPDGTRYENMIMNLPPRHGKSRTLILFCEWVLGKDQSNRIMTASYNEDLATVFSRYTRDGISEEKTLPHQVVFSDIFPGVKIKHGDGSFRQWALEGQFFNYKGAGLGGSFTGKGGNILIVDDPIKNAEEAYNENMLDKQWQFFTDTFLSRQEQRDNSIKIVNMTRWSKGDICGRILTGPEAKEWYVLNRPVEDEHGNMLCEDLLSKKRFESMKKMMDPAILNANYYQQPVDIKGKLYKQFKTYEQIPRDTQGNPLFESIINYTDTADDGSDYLCSVVAGVYQGEGYVLDVYYTKDGMEITEPQTADFIVQNKVNVTVIESNNGGKGFARNVRRIILEKHKVRAVVKWFHQSKNKRSRILSNSTFVMEHLYFPVNWKDRWPEYFKAMDGYQKEGGNKNDDAPDATTGLAEWIQGKWSMSGEEEKKERKRPNRKRA